jgi:phage N-6-adenine-methyltransferase
VSERTVRSARTVLKDGAPELIASVDRGDVPVSRAEKIVRGTQGTGDNEWYTPEEFLDAARIVLGGFDLDPASSVAAQDSVEAEQYFTVNDDGLQQEWHGRVWLNPPYAQPHIENFVSKLVSEYCAGRTTAAILLTHNYTDTAWFHEALGCADAICFTRGRVRFLRATGEIASPTQGQVFFYFGDDIERFAQVFVEVGFVLPVPECFQSVAEEMRLAA